MSGDNVPTGSPWRAPRRHATQPRLQDARQEDSGVFREELSPTASLFKGALVPPNIHGGPTWGLFLPPEQGKQDGGVVES